jgi:hypothetical protein
MRAAAVDEAVVAEPNAGAGDYVLDVNVAGQRAFPGEGLAEGQTVGEGAAIRRRGGQRISDESAGEVGS